MGPHGIPMSEAMDESNQWAVDTPRDYAAQAVEVVKAQRRKDYPDDPQHGVMFIPRKL